MPKIRVTTVNDDDTILDIFYVEPHSRDPDAATMTNAQLSVAVRDTLEKKFEVFDE
jgi:hypothetical protein